MTVEVPTILGRDREGYLVAESTFERGSVRFRLTECCRASAKGAESPTGVVCRKCYRTVDAAYGAHVNEDEPITPEELPPAKPPVGLPYAHANEDGSRNCPVCGKDIPETYDSDGEQTSSNYGEHYEREHGDKDYSETGYTEVTVVVDGALDKEETFRNPTGAQAYIEAIIAESKLDKVPTQIFKLDHDHAEGEECECAQYVTDHKPIYDSEWGDAS